MSREGDLFPDVELLENYIEFSSKDLIKSDLLESKDFKDYDALRQIFLKYKDYIDTKIDHKEIVKRAREMYRTLYSKADSSTKKILYNIFDATYKYKDIVNDILKVRLAYSHSELETDQILLPIAIVL